MPHALLIIINPVFDTSMGCHGEFVGVVVAGGPDCSAR